jgi:acetaldehyde dehydrogenase (acetylating)
VVNTPTTLGSIGLTTGLDPAMTLGCGGWGGNITSDNISPLHLINVKRLAYEIRPARPAEAGKPGPGASAPPLSSRVDAFLGARGFHPASAAGASSPRPATAVSAPSERPAGPLSGGPGSEPAPAPAMPPPVPFVCEDDVRAAAKAGRRIVIGPKTIVTPAARDAGEALRLFDLHA